MTNYIPKLSESLSINFDRLKIIDILIEGFEQRLEAQDAYEKALLRVAQKFNAVNINLPIFGVTAGEIGKAHAQRSYQIGNYKEQLKNDLTHLKKFSKQIAGQIDGKNKQFKKIQKDFKVNLQKVEKAKDHSIQCRKDLDQKIILNQIGKLNLDVSQNQRKKLFEAGTKLAAEQKQIEATYFSSVYQMTDATKLFNSSTGGMAQQIQTIANKLSVEFYDFIKKYSIHQINYLRNVEYDLNTWVKKIQTRQAQPSEEAKVQPLSEYVDSRQTDGWQQTRLYLVTETLSEYVQDQKSDEQIQQKFEKAVQSQYIDQFITEMVSNYKDMKQPLSKYIQLYRLKNKFKFEQSQFSNLSRLFSKLCQLAFKDKDLDFLQKILLYSMTYYKLVNGQKRFVIQEIKQNKFFFQLDFWRFFCYFSLRSTLTNFKKKKQITQSSQTSLHQRNAVYSTLLTIATNMLNFGIQKHYTKNFIAKAAKIFPLSELQVTEIIRFIDNQGKDHKTEKKGK